jgi:hypothetical protein
MIRVTSAYGRKYTSAEIVRQDWEADKDFHMTDGGGYINRSDWQKYNKGMDSVVFSNGVVRMHLEIGFLP